MINDAEPDVIIFVVYTLFRVVFLCWTSANDLNQPSFIHLAGKQIGSCLFDVQQFLQIFIINSKWDKKREMISNYCFLVFSRVAFDERCNMNTPGVPLERLRGYCCRTVLNFAIFAYPLVEISGIEQLTSWMPSLPRSWTRWKWLKKLLLPPLHSSLR